MVDVQPLRRALISVHDKTGLSDFARALVERGVELISTGGTAQHLRDLGLNVIDVSAVTGFPEIMDGRVKTLHPAIHGGLLARRDDAAHCQALDEHGILPIDLLVSSLYPFEFVVAQGRDFATCIENIDVGGPAMIRAAAKNHAFVAVVTDPADYDHILEDMNETGGGTKLDTRKTLAGIAFRRTAAYDSMIGSWFARMDRELFPERLTIAARRGQILRYGENPHQSAALYLTEPAVPGVARARQIQGKELSYNNLNDTEAAIDLLAELGTERAAAVIVKHANPCGVALSNDVASAYQAAFDCDPVSAFGGIIALNRPLDEAAARAISAIFTEVIIAPAADADARAIIGLKKNLRLLLLDALPDPRREALILKSIQGGFLVQSVDNGETGLADLKVVTRRAPNERELADLLFAFRVAKHVKSNAIVYVRDGATVGIGAGQMSRVDAARIASLKAADVAATKDWPEPRTIGSVVASDAFFPFADGLLAAAAAGARAVIQPGGSMRDDEVIKAADDADLAMVFTGKRHFRH